PNPYPTPAPAPAPAPSPAPAPAPQSGSGDLVKYGGMAVIGMLAWNAFRKWQSQSGGRSAFTSGAPEAAGFAPAAAPGGADAFSGVLLSAMAAAAQSDGQIDHEELERITGGLSRMGAAAPERDALISFLTTPVDPQQVVDAATGPEAALQIYAASALAIRPDSATEKQYLASLASALGIDPGLKAQVDADLNA
ncbi:tellurite resistance TerB family protein, partial [Xanthobacter autotrophicus]|uniref:tellurite resistance TerB family protein n=1 Tax=Xanthobacter autotrophicus TaxID=280 RepID=UPI0024A630AA